MYTELGRSCVVGVKVPQAMKDELAFCIESRKVTLDLLDKRILQDAKNAELKTLIEKDLRPTIEKHLKDAEALVQKLAPAGTTGTGMTSGTSSNSTGGTSGTSGTTNR